MPAPSQSIVLLTKILATLGPASESCFRSLRSWPAPRLMPPQALSLYYGLTPTYMDQPEGTAELIRAVDGSLREAGWAEVGDPIVVMVGEPIGQADYTNSIRIHTVRDS